MMERKLPPATARWMAMTRASTTVLINDATTLKARDNVLISGSARRFIRVQVTAAP